MLTKIGGRWRTLREWVTLHEWLPRILRLPPPPQEGFRPGLFLVELVGCDEPAWQRARARGAFPFLDALLERQNYRALDYHAGCPWSRVAREAELLHGAVDALPGELFYPLGEKEPVDLARRADVLAAAPRLDRRGEGLLVQGAAWGTLLPGGAPPAEFHGPLGDRREGWVEWLRNRLGAALDLRRGMPVVYLRHEYDASGSPGEDVRVAEWLKVDRLLARLYHRARRCRRRDYEIWFLLTPSSPPPSPNSPEADEPAAYARVLQAGLGESWDVRAEGEAARKTSSGRGLRVLARDGLAHLYADASVPEAEKLSVARLVVRADPAAHAVLWRQADGTTRWHRAVVPGRDASAPPPGVKLADWLPHLVENDAAALLESPCAGTWIVLRGEPRAALRGGVALVPRRARFATGRGDWIRASQVYSAARHALGRERLRRDAAAPAVLHPETFRLATYNAHRCIGMDGRQSVRRILRVLAEVDADIIALQEVSAVGFNQAEHIAAELGMHSVFCPTLHGADAYGHGLLSRHPFTVNAVGLLPLTFEASYKEPRGAIWVRVQMGLRSLHVVSTHLALGRADRSAQVDALLGPHWIGGLPSDAPVILCGDFNFTPPGRNYRRIASRLRDVQLAHSTGPVLKTFSTVCAVARLDHIFLSPHFTVLGVDSPRTHLTQVASDHFPLVADLRWPKDGPG